MGQKKLCRKILIRVQDIVGKESAKVGQGKAFKEGWIIKDKDTLKIKVHHFLKLTEDELIRLQAESITDASREQLQIIQKSRTHPDPKVINDLKKRKLVVIQKVTVFEIMKGPKFAKEFVKEETDLTADMLAR